MPDETQSAAPTEERGDCRATAAHGPYPKGTVGYRQAATVERRARAIARAHGSFWRGGGHGARDASLLDGDRPPVLR